MSDKNNMIELIKRVTDENILYDAFYQEDNEKIRKIILNKTRSDRLIEEVIKNKNFTSDLRCIAVSKCNLNLRTRIIEDTDEDCQVRKAAINSLNEVNFDWYDWYKLYKNEKRCDLKFLIIKEKIKSQKDLVDIIINQKEDISLKKEALKKIDDDETLIYILNCENISEHIKIIAYYKVRDFKKVIDNILKIVSSCEDCIVLKEILERLFTYNNQKVIADVLIELTHNKSIVDYCLKEVKDKELLQNIYKNANFWYTRTLALEKLEA